MNPQNAMIERLSTLVPEERILETMVPGVKIFRVDESFLRTPKSYESQIIILAQGKKTVYLDSEVFTYDPLNYLVLAVPLPIECEAVAKPGEPILGITINVDPTTVGEILLEMDELKKPRENLPRGIYSAPLNDELSDATLRLLEAASSRSSSRILGPMVVREILFRIMSEEHGGAMALQALALNNRGFFQIARILNIIHELFHTDLDVPTLAGESGMSVSTFHTNFKAVTGTSPLQYIKSVRLHKARQLMSKEGYNATTASFEVGYESPSQFSREYKRFFGTTPARDSVMA